LQPLHRETTTIRAGKSRESGKKSVRNYFEIFPRKGGNFGFLMRAQTITVLPQLEMEKAFLPLR